MKRTSKTVACVFAVILLSYGALAVGQKRAATEKTVMHVVAFTPNEGVGSEDFAALKSATETLLATLPGLRRAWVGELRQPLVVGSETRTHGLIFEFDDVKSRQEYSSHPSRVPWAKFWDKVRKSSTIVDVIGTGE